MELDQATAQKAILGIVVCLQKETRFPSGKRRHGYGPRNSRDRLADRQS